MVAIFLYMHGLLASSSILQTVASDPHIFFNFFKAYLLKETSINVNYLLSCWEGVFTITTFHQYYFEIAFPLIGTSLYFWYIWKCKSLVKVVLVKWPRKLVKQDTQCILTWAGRIYIVCGHGRVLTVLIILTN